MELEKARDKASVEILQLIRNHPRKWKTKLSLIEMWDMESAIEKRLIKYEQYLISQGMVK